MNRVLHYRGKAAEFFARWRWRWWVLYWRIKAAWHDRRDLRARLIGEDVIRFIPIGDLPCTRIEQVCIGVGLFGWRDTGIIKATSSSRDMEITSFAYRGQVMDSLETALSYYRQFGASDENQ